MAYEYDGSVKMEMYIITEMHAYGLGSEEIDRIVNYTQCTRCSLYEVWDHYKTIIAMGNTILSDVTARASVTDIGTVKDMISMEIKRRKPEKPPICKPVKSDFPIRRKILLTNSL